MTAIQEQYLNMIPKGGIELDKLADIFGVEELTVRSKIAELRKMGYSVASRNCIVYKGEEAEKYGRKKATPKIQEDSKKESQKVPIIMRLSATRGDRLLGKHDWNGIGGSWVQVIPGR